MTLEAFTLEGKEGIERRDRKEVKEWKERKKIRRKKRTGRRETGWMDGGKEGRNGTNKG
jgi:hypothetical protein